MTGIVTAAGGGGGGVTGVDTRLSHTSQHKILSLFEYNCTQNMITTDGDGK